MDLFIDKILNLILIPHIFEYSIVCLDNIFYEHQNMLWNINIYLLAKYI